MKFLLMMVVAFACAYCQQVDVMKLGPKGLQAVQGSWDFTDGKLRSDGRNAARANVLVAPSGDYDFRMKFTRTSGQHSVAMFFTHGGGQASFEVDAWSQGISGFQNVGGQDIRNNGTRQPNRLQNGTAHTMEVRVRGNEVRGYLDQKHIATYQGTGSDLSVPGLWSLPLANALGVGVYQSGLDIHELQVRSVGRGRLIPAKGNSQPTPPAPPARGPQQEADPVAVDASGKKVLLVIANEDFFYREYADPKQALESAGVEVVVAAGSRETCRPHRGSGYRNGSGEVRPDTSLANAKANEFDAILFAGGWGSSMYQYAFEGRYNKDAYNGSSTIKRHTNRLINEFDQQQKWVAGLCHGVGVLAWSRVNGKSILDGKRVCSYPRGGPPGRYPDGSANKPSAWNAQINGATVSPSRSIGDPRTDRDDVLVDGRVITAENDGSARAIGETLARLLAN